MRQPHTSYPVRGVIPETTPGGTSHYLFVAASLPSYAPPLVEFTTKTSYPTEDVSAIPLARIALNNRNVVQHGLIELNPIFEFRTEEIDTLSRFSNKYNIAWMALGSSLLVTDPLQEQTIFTSTREGAQLTFTASNQAILLASVRALAMQLSSSSRP